MNTLLVIFDSATLAFFGYATIACVLGVGLKWHEKLAALLCGLIMQTAFLVDILIRIGGLHK